jgi:hypothetical protein
MEKTAIIINPNAGPSTLKEKLENLNPISNQENFEVFIPKENSSSSNYIFYAICALLNYFLLV